MKIPASIVFQKNWDAYKAGYRILLNEGSSRSTKTWSFFLFMHTFAYSLPKRRIIVLRDTAVACRDLVESEFKDWMEDPLGRLNQAEKGVLDFETAFSLMQEESLLQHVKVNQTKHRYTYPNGSTIIFTGADNVNQIIGKQNHLVWINEPYAFPEKVLTQLLKRLKDVLLIDWNPSEDLYIENYKSRSDCKVIHSTFKDNPFLAESVRNELLAAEPLQNKYFDIEVSHYVDWDINDMVKDLQQKEVPEKEIKRAVRCWHNEKEGTADPYQWDVYGLGIKAEKPNRIFRFKPIADFQYYELNVPVYYGVDWGAVDPMGILEAKYYDGALYFREISYLSENKIKAKLTATERAQIVEQDEGFIKWYFSRLNLNPDATFVCDNNRHSKILALRKIGYEYALAARKGPGSIIDGIDLLNSLDVYYTASSKNFKKEQELYSRKEDQHGNVMNEPEDKNNHLMDPARYIAQFLQDENIIRIVA